MSLYSMQMDSPVGALTLVADNDGLRAILWDKEREGRVVLGETQAHADHPVLLETQRQLTQYFAGERTDFDLPLSAAGTDFQKRVWAALLAIPFGKTQTYGELATSAGSPGASRAAGAAAGRNPLSIVIPCHRAIGSTGALTGFAGGLPAKAFLLSLEREHPAVARCWFGQERPSLISTPPLHPRILHARR